MAVFMLFPMIELLDDRAIGAVCTFHLNRGVGDVKAFRKQMLDGVQYRRALILAPGDNLNVYR